MTTHNKPRERILIVDDEPESVWPLIKHLEKDYDILCATTGEQALERAFAPQKPDLILLDVMLPDIDGYEICSRLKENAATQEIPVIFVTSKQEEKSETKGFSLGAQDYIVKPYSLEKVRVRVHSVLNLKREMDRRLFLKTQLEELNGRFENQIKEQLQELEQLRKDLNAYEKQYNTLFSVGPSIADKKRILIVDDIPENIHILIGYLQSQYEILCASNGQAALDIAFSAQPPDLILLDIMMPGMDGYEVCSRLKANSETWHIPVIFVTAMDQEIDETKGFSYGAVDFVTKPFSPAVLHARIKASLRLQDEMGQRILLTKKLELLNRDLEDKITLQTLAIQRASDDLKASEQKYKDIYDNAPEGIFQSTFDGRFLTANPALARILGYASVEELVNHLADIKNQLYVYPRERNELILQLETNEAVNGFEFQAYRKDGEISWVSINARVVKDRDGNPLFIEGFLTDITEKRKLEEQLRQAAKMEAIGNLVSGVSHDFNNMITPIIGFSELLLVDNSLDDKSRRFLGEIKKSGERAAALTRRLLAFSRKQISQPQFVDLNQVITDINKILTSVIRDDIELVIEKGEDPGQIFIDPTEIEQVIMNLVVNAKDSMKNGGELTIKTARVTLDEPFTERGFEAPPGEYVMMSVSDSGTGMDQKTLERIFEPFFTTKDIGKGTGIGLATVYGIVKHCRGYISVQSKTDIGSTFSIYLPVVDASANKNVKPPEISQKYQGNETVIVIEDNTGVRELAEAILKQYGYSVVTAMGGQKGLDFLNDYSGPLDLLLTDVVMSDMSGINLYEKMLSRFPELKVIYMSGYTNELFVKQGLLEREVEFLQKPFGVKMLASKVRSVLDS